MGGENRPWWDRPLRVLQFNFEDRLGLYVSRVAARDLVELASRLHVNTLVVFARDAWGYTYYRGARAGPPRPGLRGDFLRELVEEAHRRGIRVVAMVAHTTNKLLYMKHSDWGQVNRRGEPVLLEHAPPEPSWEPEWPLLCPNSPFLEHARLEVREAASLGVDGVFFDSFRYQPDPEKACYCKWCRARFEKEHGYEMPTEPDWSDSRWRTLWDWRYRVVVEALRELAEEARRVRSDIHVMYNSHPGGWAGRTNRVVELSRGILDGVFAECSEADFEPPGFIAEMVKLTRAMTGFQGKVYASRNGFYSLRPPEPAPPVLVRQGLREAFITGGEPWLLVFSSTLANLRDEFIEGVAEAFREHEKLEEFIQGSEPVRYAAVVVSNTVRDHYGRLEPAKYVDETRGIYYMLQHSHVPVEYLLDRDTPSLHKEYRVLVLADLACTSKSLLEAVKSHVSRGGAVVATHETSLYTEDCYPAGGLQAGELLGARLLGEPIELEWLYIEAASPHPVLENLPPRILVGDIRRDMGKPLWLASIVPVEPLNAEAPLVARQPAYRFGHEYTLGRSAPPPGPLTRLPALLLRERTAYYPWRLGANYWHTGSPSMRRLLLNTLKRLGAKPPVEVEAPTTVISEAWRQGSDRVIIHLLNYTTNQRFSSIPLTGARQPLPGYSSPLQIHPVWEVIPVTGIKVLVSEKLINRGKKLKAYSPLTGRSFPIKYIDDYARIEINVVKEYEVIILE